MWEHVLGGLFLCLIGFAIFLGGEGGIYHGIRTVDWIWIPIIGVGVAVILVGIRGHKRGEIYKPGRWPYTDEDVAKAKEDMDRPYEREHGRPPELWVDPKWAKADEAKPADNSADNSGDTPAGRKPDEKTA